jgi:hypothetical protein
MNEELTKLLKEFKEACTSFGEDDNGGNWLDMDYAESALVTEIEKQIANKP